MLLVCSVNGIVHKLVVVVVVVAIVAQSELVGDRLLYHRLIEKKRRTTHLSTKKNNIHYRYDYYVNFFRVVESSDNAAVAECIE